MGMINSNGPRELSAEEIVDEASKPDVDQIHGEIGGDDETGLDYEETAHGSEERKREVKEEAEENDG